MILLTLKYCMVMWEERGHRFVYNLVVTMQIIWLLNASTGQSGSSIPKSKVSSDCWTPFNAELYWRRALSHIITPLNTQWLRISHLLSPVEQDGGLLFHTVVALPNTVLDGISVCLHAFIDWLTRSWYYIKCFRPAFCYQFWLLYKRTLCN